jgi:hypothetical protein
MIGDSMRKIAILLLSLFCGACDATATDHPDGLVLLGRWQRFDSKPEYLKAVVPGMRYADMVRTIGKPDCGRIGVDGVAYQCGMLLEVKEMDNLVANTILTNFNWREAVLTIDFDKDQRIISRKIEDVID